MKHVYQCLVQLQRPLPPILAAAELSACSDDPYHLILTNAIERVLMQIESDGLAMPQ